MRRKQIYDAKKAKRAISSVLIGSLLVSACAATNYRTEGDELYSLSESDRQEDQSEWRRRLISQMFAAASEADRQRCEEFAQAEADAIKGELHSMPGALLGSMVFAKGAPFAFGLFGIPAIAYEGSLINKARTTTYEEVVKACLEPTVLEANLGPEHSELARSLISLADRYKTARKYVEAEALYRRALAIQEKARGSEHPDLVTVLKAYAAVLARLDRQSEAEGVVARYQAIQENLAQSKMGQKTDAPPAQDQADGIQRGETDHQNENSKGGAQ